MRFLFKASIPVAKGNEVVRAGKLGSTIEAILAEQKPECAYFIAENGQRTAVLVINMDDVSELPAIAEPWLLALDASIECQPAMTAADLQKAGPAIEAAAQKFS